MHREFLGKCIGKEAPVGDSWGIHGEFMRKFLGKCIRKCIRERVQVWFGPPEENEFYSLASCISAMAGWAVGLLRGNLADGR